jgi:hypothetical protein
MSIYFKMLARYWNFRDEPMEAPLLHSSVSFGDYTFMSNISPTSLPVLTAISYSQENLGNLKLPSDK